MTLPSNELAPEDRLALSRQKMREGLARYAPQRAADSRAANASTEDEPGELVALIESLANNPPAVVAVRWVRRWWRRHPWRATFDLGSAVVDELAKPVARSHPWLLVGGALVLGMVLARARPWRWISAGALLTGLLPRISLTSLMSWVTSLVAETSKPAAGPASTASPRPATDEPGGDVAAAP